MLDLVVFIVFLLIAGGNYLLTGWFIKYARLRRITDVPTERSSHKIPTPRAGGVGFVIISIVAFSIYFAWMGILATDTYVVMLLTLTAIACLGWFDDRNNLSQTIRLSIQLLAAVSVIFFIEGLDTFFLPYISNISLGIFSPVLGLLWIMGATNIYNFMDGVDGIASVQALTASTGWMIIANLWNEPILFTVNLIVFATVAAFLMYNWSPAKIFMGDVGSVFLGFFFAMMPFLAATLADDRVIGFTLWIGAILLWPFLFDGTYTLVRRLIKGENIFQAHRSHLYQRLNIAGWSHDIISILYLAFSLVCIIFALIFIHESNEIQIVIIAGLLFLSYLYIKGVAKIERKS